MTSTTTVSAMVDSITTSNPVSAGGDHLREKSRRAPYPSPPANFPDRDKEVPT
jgi:hypothetical protein